MFNINDIVTVTVERPKGTHTIVTKGDVGIVVKVAEEQVCDSATFLLYHVKTENDTWVYAKDEIRLATEGEIRNKFVRLLTR